MSTKSFTEVAVGILLTWCVAILGLYFWNRDWDLQPILASCGGRLLDALVPAAILMLYSLPAARFVRWLTPDFDRAPTLVLTAGVSLFMAMAVGIVAGVLGLFSVWIFVGVPVAASLACRSQAGWLSEQTRTLLGEVGDELRSFPGVLFLAISAAALIMTLTPAVSQDALHYHLAVPDLWVEAGSFADVPGNVYSRFPMNTEILFLQAMVIRGEIAAKAFHWLFAVLAALSAGSVCVRLGGRKWGLWSALLMMAIPSVFQVSSWAYVEMAGVFYLLLAWRVFLEQKRTARLVGLCALLLGIACGIKYTYLLPATAICLLLTIGSRQAWLRHGFLCIGAALIGGGFWYVRNWIEVGNPFFPFAYSVFGGEGWDLERAQIFDAFLRQWGGSGVSLPWDVTFDSTFFSIHQFDGVIGPVFLLSLPLVLWAFKADPRTRSTVLLAVFLAATWVATTHQVRFLIPTLALLCCLIPVAWLRLDGTGRAWIMRLTAVGVLLCLPSHLLIFARTAPIAFAVGVESEDAHLERMFPGGDYAVFRDLERYVPKDGKVLFAGSGNPVYYCDRAFHADSVVENHTLRRLLGESSFPIAFCEAFRKEGFTHLLFKFPLVFGRDENDGDLTPDEKQLLANVLSEYGRLETRAGDTLLYRIGDLP